MQQIFSFKDRHGKVSLWLDDEVLVSEFTGTCSATLARRYQQAVVTQTEHLSSKPWGYVSCSVDFEAATDNALDVLLDTYKICIANNCVADAYVLDSALGRSQIETMRAHFKGLRPNAQVMFDNLDLALFDVKQRLTQITAAVSS